MIDTCIVIDVLQGREEFKVDAQNIFLAAKSVTDIYYLTHRYTHSDKETRKIINTLFSLFDFIDYSGMGCRRTLTSDISDYENEVIIESAVRVDVDSIVTRNQKNYHKLLIPLYSRLIF